MPKIEKRAGTRRGKRASELKQMLAIIKYLIHNVLFCFAAVAAITGQICNIEGGIVDSRRPLLLASGTMIFSTEENRK